MARISRREEDSEGREEFDGAGARDRAGPRGPRSRKSGEKTAVARIEVLAERTGAEEYEAGLQAHTADMAHFGRPGEDHKDTRVELRPGTDTSRRVHVHHNGQGDTGSKRVRGAADGRDGIV